MLLLLPALSRPVIAFALAGAVVAVRLAWKSVAYPLALVSAPPIIDSVVGSNPLPKGGFTFLFAAWIGLAVLFVIMRGEHVAPVRALASAPVVLSYALLVLLVLRLGPSADPSYGNTKVGLFAADNLVFLVGAVFVGASRRDRKLFFSLTLAIAGVSAFLLVFQLLSGNAQQVLGGRFSLSAQEYPIHLGRESADGLLIAISLMLARTGSSMRFVALAALPALAVTLIAAGSRGPIVAFALGLLVLIALSVTAGRGRRQVLIVVGCLAAAAIAVPLIVPGSAIGRSLSTIIGSASGLSSNGRSELWATAYAVLGSHPLLGMGTGGFRALHTGLDYPHNILLEIGAELGMAGAVLVVGIIGGAIRRLTGLWRATYGEEQLESMLVISLFMMAVVNAMFSGAIQDNAEIWLWLGVGLGAGAGVVAPHGPTPLAHRGRLPPRVKN